MVPRNEHRDGLIQYVALPPLTPLCSLGPPLVGRPTRNRRRIGNSHNGDGLISPVKLEKLRSGKTTAAWLFTKQLDNTGAVTGWARNKGSRQALAILCSYALALR
jgi:hypothetical protein